MPYLYRPIQDVASRIIDPVVSQVWGSVLDQLSLRQTFQDNIYINNDRSAASQTDDGHGNINLQRNQCKIEVDTAYNPSEQFWNTWSPYGSTASGMSKTTANTYQTIFLDPEAKMSIQEMTQVFGLTLTFEMTFLSYDVAQQTLTNLYNQNLGTIVNHVHDIVYSYPVDLTTLCALWAVYKSKTDYPDKSASAFFTYINAMSQAQFKFDVRRVDLVQSQQETQFAVKRQQMNCQALLSCDQQKPEVVLEDNMPRAYSLTFTYRIQFGRPSLLQILMPIMVDQTPIPSWLFDKPAPSFMETLQGIMQNQVFDSAIKHLSGPNPMTIIAQVPNYDDWSVPENSLISQNNYNPFFIGASMLNTQGVTSMPLTNLGDYQLGTFVKELLALHSADDLYYNDALFNVSIFSDDVALDRIIYQWDPQTLTISYTASRVHNIYRVVISETTDLTKVHPKWYPTILKYRYNFPMTLMRNANYLFTKNYWSVGSTDQLIQLIDKVRLRGLLDTVVAQMIALGDADYSLRFYTQTSDQFASYLCNTQARVQTNEDPHVVVSKTLFDSFLNVCVSLNLAASNQLPTMYIKAPASCPYGSSGVGGFSQFQIPQRIWNVTLTPHTTKD